MRPILESKPGNGREEETRFITGTMGAFAYHGSAGQPTLFIIHWTGEITGFPKNAEQ
jgi:hypothetical protein